MECAVQGHPGVEVARPTRRRQRSRIARSRPSRAAGSRISPASTPSSRRPMSRPSGTWASTTRRSSAFLSTGPHVPARRRFGPQGMRRISALCTSTTTRPGSTFTSRRRSGTPATSTIPANPREELRPDRPRRQPRTSPPRFGSSASECSSSAQASPGRCEPSLQRARAEGLSNADRTCCARRLDLGPDVAARFVDPVLVTLVVLLTIGVPIPWPSAAWWRS